MNIGKIEPKIIEERILVYTVLRPIRDRSDKGNWIKKTKQFISFYIFRS